MMFGEKAKPVEDIPCGSIVGIIGIDSFLNKCGTITTIDDAYPAKPYKFNISPIVRTSIQCENPQDLPKMQDGLRLMEKSDLMITCSTYPEYIDQYIISATGNIHLDIKIKDMTEVFCKG